MFTPNVPSRPPRSGVTLLELATVVLILLILMVVLLPAYQGLQARAGRAGCTANLRSLHVAADLYLQEHHTWPQIQVSGFTEQQTATAWINALHPYGTEVSTWVCPTTQGNLHHPDLNDPDNVRVDYIATPFQSGQQYPYKWPNQPWFIERIDAHGSGNLIIFPDGHVNSAVEVLAHSKKPPAG